MRQAARAGDLLKGLLSGLGIDERLHQYQALLVWDDVVGPQIAARTKPEKIRDGVLEVCVDQPTWMQQLQLLKPQILAKLNSRLGDAPLREIFLKRGRVERTAKGTPPPVGPNWRSATLSADEETALDAMLQKVGDEQLRRRMKALLEKQSRLNRARGKD